MARIERGRGGTPSEQVLARIAENSFLSLWTYPSPYKDQKLNGKGDGKELCDLLVVCGDDVLIFSDKAIGWSVDKDDDVAWARWFRAAVRKSADQVASAESWISKFPNRVFLDKDCTQPLPVELPPPGRRRVHGIVVALGAEAATRSATGHPAGMHVVSSDLRGDAHWDRDNPDFQPFVIGDIAPERSFVHVFNQQAIELVLRMLDTVDDFTKYLQRRAEAIRKGLVVHAFGESDLVAYYLSKSDSRGEHGFLRPNGRLLKRSDRLFIAPGQFDALVRDAAFARKLEADEISYLWDRLVAKFAQHILDGTSIGADGGPVDSRDADVSLRIMARENRLSRRIFSDAMMEAHEGMQKRSEQRFARVLVPAAGSGSGTVAYVFVIMAVPDSIDPDSDYESYRRFRKATAGIYALAVLQEHSEFDECIAIAVDAPAPHRRSSGVSEDLVYVHRDGLTPERSAELVVQRRTLGILASYRAGKGSRLRAADEFPDAAATARSTGNRRERRARRSKATRRSA